MNQAFLDSESADVFIVDAAAPGAMRNKCCNKTFIYI